VTSVELFGIIGPYFWIWSRERYTIHKKLILKSVVWKFICSNQLLGPRRETS